MAKVFHELPPNAGRMIESLRDAGYDFETAVADIVDNSISAGATMIEISATCSLKNGNIRVIIADNGKGMSFEEVCNAMTYGSDERLEEHSLGKFGLGLKTASTSQCRKLSLVSRRKGTDKPVKLVLDIDHTAETNKWEYMEVEPKPDDYRYLEHVAPGNSGTVVKWKKCDRILTRKYSTPGGPAQQKAFEGKLSDLRFHLGIVFQRFLDHDDERAANVTIALNGQMIVPWDPFCKIMSATEEIVNRSIELHDGESNTDVSLGVGAYVVPSRDELTAQEEELVFPKNMSPDKLQGIYIYRENRLIHWGDWCKLAKNEFHQRLCRIELSFGAELDDCFHVDFKKSKISIDSSVASWLKPNVIDPARKAAELRYRGGETAAAKKAAKEVHKKANNTIAKRAAEERAYFIQHMPDQTVKVTNQRGATFIDAKPVEKDSTDMPIVPTESLPDDMLWEARIFKNDDGRIATRAAVNVSHPFYQRAYKACRGNEEAIKALDYFIWSLADAEYATKDEKSVENYEDMRREVSHRLRKLAENIAPSSL